MAIGKLLRENAALAVGISLPVLVVFFFLLATYVPRWLVDAPQYDFLFTQDGRYSNEHPRWRYVVDLDASSQLRVQAFPTEPDEYAWRPQLFLYEHETSGVREISLPVPESSDLGEDGVLVEIPEFSDSIIDSHQVAPDGYELVDRGGRHGNLMSLFYRGNRDDLAISKNGAVVAVGFGQEPNRYYYNPRFVGWVIPPSDR